MSLVKSAGFLEEILLASEDIRKCYGSLAKLARHLEEPVMITGSLATSWHLLENGRRIKKQRLSDIDVVVEGVASVEIDVHELAMLLEGIDIRRARTSARWEPPMHASRIG